MKTFALGLGLANLFLWAAGSGTLETAEPEILRRKIADLERTLPGKLQTAAWAARVQPALEAPPTDTPEAALARLRAVGGAAGFEFGELAHQGENPWTLTIGGRGDYRAVTALLGELDRSATTRIERIKLEVTDDRRIETHVEALIRSGSWTGPPSDGFPEPDTVPGPGPLLGTQDLFNLGPAPEPPRETRLPVRFLGLYAGAGTPTAILEEGGQSVLVIVGERTPAGTLVRTADQDQAELEDERGSRWSVPMEKAR